IAAGRETAAPGQSSTPPRPFTIPLWRLADRAGPQQETSNPQPQPDTKDIIRLVKMYPLAVFPLAICVIVAVQTYRQHRASLTHIPGILAFCITMAGLLGFFGSASV